jgi:hypothetical protein
MQGRGYKLGKEQGLFRKKPKGMRGWNQGAFQEKVIDMDVFNKSIFEISAVKSSCDYQIEYLLTSKGLLSDGATIR